MAIGALLDIGKTAAKVGDNFAKVVVDASAAAAKVSGKVPTGAFDNILKNVATKAGKVGSDIASKVDDIASGAGKVGSDIGSKVDDIAGGAGKVGSKVDDVAGGAGKVGSKVDDIAGGAGKVGSKVDDIAEKAAKASSFTKNLKRGAIAVTALGGLVALGLEAKKIHDKSEETFKARNEKEFQITKIVSTTGQMAITFNNPDGLLIYPDEEVELIDVDINVNGNRYKVIKTDNGVTTFVVNTKAPYNNFDVKKGVMKLYANQSNDVQKAIEDELNKARNALGVGFCATLNTFGITPYVNHIMTVFFVLFILFITYIFFYIPTIVSVVFPGNDMVKNVSILVTIGMIIFIGFVTNSLFVLNC
jgi:hypothetical protein